MSMHGPGDVDANSQAMSPHADAEPRRSRRVGSSRTVTQRRELLRLLFAGIAVKHVGYRNGPRVDLGRLVITWAR